MGSYETPVHRLVVNEIVLTNRSQTSGISGRVLLSASKLMLDTGSAWETITSS